MAIHPIQAPQRRAESSAAARNTEHQSHNAEARDVSTVTIFHTGIRQDTQGRFSLNDLHRAAGGAGKCSTQHVARRVLHNFCPKRRVHPRQLSLL